MNKNAFYQLSYGVYVVSTWDKGRATGCTANSAMQITSSPATIAISINHDNYTTSVFRIPGNSPFLFWESIPVRGLSVPLDSGAERIAISLTR